MYAREIRVASIGECMIELRHVTAIEMTMAFGGDTLNMAVYLARLGATAGIRVNYVTALGDDPYSDGMIEGWRVEGVDTELVRRLPGRMPGLYLIRTDDHGERSFFYYRSEAAARDMLRGPEARPLLAALPGFDLVYLSGITLSILDQPQRERLIEALADVRRAGGRVAFDGNFRPRGWPDLDEARAVYGRLLHHVDIALPTLDDERALFADPDVDASIGRLHGYGVREVVVKDGAAGCHLSADGRRAFSPSRPIADVVDTTAAGDSFNAGYLAARLVGAEPLRAATVGHTLAGEVIRHRGALIPKGAMPDLVLGGRTGPG